MKLAKFNRNEILVISFMEKNIIKLFALTCCFLLFLCTPSIAAPVISSLSGEIKDGNEVTITGDNFGKTGPTVFLFDDFSNGTDGKVFDTNATIGEWSNTGGRVFSDTKLSNGQGSRQCGDITKNGIIFESTKEEFFISSIAYVPDGYNFPGADSEETIADSSNLKHAWVYNTSSGYKGRVDNYEPDMWMPGNPGGSWQTVLTNDAGSPRSGWRSTEADQQWVWDEPVKWAVWFKGNGTNDNGSREYHQAISASGHTFYENHNVAWFDDLDASHGFNRMTMPGYLYGTSYPEHNYVIDDVYIAIGDNAAARVEIGNAKNYTDCTQMAISTPNNWSNDKITFNFREGTFNSGQEVYVFVIDAENNPSAGYGPIYIGKDYDLSPPDNLKIIKP